MYTFLIVCHVLIALVLVVVVLLQSGKGGGLGAGFGGGGANTLFGSSGGSNFFTKLTMAMAAGFMLTSLGLTAISTKALKTSIFDQAGTTNTAPAAPAAAPVGAPTAAPGEKVSDVPGAAPATEPVKTK